MKRYRSILIALMILWLPLQGFAVVAMPFCQHGFHKSAHAATAFQAHGHVGPQHAHHGSTQHTGSSSGLACNDCGLCHLGSLPAAPTSTRTVEPVGTQSFTRFSPTLPPLFAPTQPHRPPLAPLA